MRKFHRYLKSFDEFVFRKLCFEFLSYDILRFVFFFGSEFNNVF